MSEQEYTPTTEEVMRGFVAPRYKVDPQREDEDFAAFLGRTSIETHQASMASEAAARRWLESHDAEVRREAAVEALREAADALPKAYWSRWSDKGGNSLVEQADEDVSAWLEARATAIENGEQTNE